MSPDAHIRSTAQLVIRAYNIQFHIKVRHSLVLSVERIISTPTHLQNMKFDVLRKKFPRVHAKGLADIGTKGIRGCKVIIRLDMALDAEARAPFTGGAVEVKIAPLAVRIHRSKHEYES